MAETQGLRPGHPPRFSPGRQPLDEGYQQVLLRIAADAALGVTTMATTWVLVAHDAGARLFENAGPGKGIELVEQIDHPDGRKRDRELESDRPGRSFGRNSGGSRRSAMSSPESAHERVIADFARSLTSRLQQARIAGDYERLVLVAPPKLLGLLRSTLDAPTEHCIVGSLDKDLAMSDEKELVKQLGVVIAV